MGAQFSTHIVDAGKKTRNLDISIITKTIIIIIINLVATVIVI